MKITTRLAVAVVAVISVAGCGGGGAPDAAASATSTTVPSGGAAGSDATSAPTTEIPVTAISVSEPDASHAPATAPATIPSTAPATTPATPAPTPGTGSVDPSTDLRAGTRTPRPAGVLIPGPAEAQATLTIYAGPHSMSRTGGTCSVIDGTTYVYAGAGDPDGINGVLQWNTAAPVQDQFLTWVYGIGVEKNLISNHGIDGDHGIVITFGAAGTSGTFAGFYIVTGEQRWRQFTGSFSCLPAPLVLRGDHPVSFLHANCNGPDSVTAGGTGNQDAAYLAIDLTTIDPYNDFEGGLTFRVDGVVYETSWLTGRLTADRVGASFIGSAHGPDGIEFSVTGAFNCL